MLSAALIPVAPACIATYLVRFPLVCQSCKGLQFCRQLIPAPIPSIFHKSCTPYVLAGELLTKAGADGFRGVHQNALVTPVDAAVGFR
jgi:hypothetical protein